MGMKFSEAIQRWTIHEDRPGYRDHTGYISVPRGLTYFYVVRAVDTSFNRSGNSNEVTPRAELRTVTLVFNVTVPRQPMRLGALSTLRVPRPAGWRIAPMGSGWRGADPRRCHTVDDH